MPTTDAHRRAAYEKLWRGGWRESSTTSPGASYRTRRRLFLSLFDNVYRPGADVLDVGCGNGSLLADIARRYPDAGALSGTDVGGDGIGATTATNATPGDHSWGQAAES